MPENNILDATAGKPMMSLPVIWESSPLLVEHHSVITELLNSDAFNRLKLIDQSGPIHNFGDMKYFHKYGHPGPTPSFTRADHSLGVLALAYKAKCGIQELVASLTHDFSHTPGSHVADHVFAQLNVQNNAEATQESYQDMVHLEFLKYFGIDKIVEDRGINFSQIDPHLPIHTALKAGREKLDADRIEYIVHTAKIYDIITQSQAKAIIDDLKFENDSWFFNNPSLAKMYGDAAIELTKEIYTPPWNFVFYQYFGKAVIHAINANIISLDDFKYGTDPLIINSLKESSDPYIQHILNRLEDIEQIFTTVGFEESDVHVKLKFRGVNPKVKMGDGEFKVLTEINSEFSQSYNELRKFCENGYGIKYNEDEVSTLLLLENYHAPTTDLPAEDFLFHNDCLLQGANAIYEASL